MDSVLVGRVYEEEEEVEKRGASGAFSSVLTLNIYKILESL